MIRQVPGLPKPASLLQKCTTAIIVVRFPAFNNVIEVVIYTKANCNTFTHNTDKWAIQETAELEVVCVVQVRQVCSAVHKGRPCQPCKLSNQSTYFHSISRKDASLLERFRLSELSLGSFQTSAYAGNEGHISGWRNSKKKKAAKRYVVCLHVPI